MDLFSIFTSLALYILTLYIIYFLVRFIVDMIRDSLLSGSDNVDTKFKPYADI